METSYKKHYFLLESDLKYILEGLLK